MPLPLLGLLAVTAAWGSTFFLLKDLLDRVPPADFLAVRFAVAALVLTAVVPRAAQRLSPVARRRGALLGALYAGGQLLQTVGLQTTSASVSGFVTGMYVVATPLLGAVLLRQRLGPRVWLAVALATGGLGVLSLRLSGGAPLGTGELLTLAGAVLYAGHIVGLGAWSRSEDALGLTVVQLWVVAALTLVPALPGGVTLPQQGADWAALLYMAVVAAVLAMLVQTWAQAHLSPTRAAIVMTMEPVWAAGFAVALGGESTTWRLLVGGGLVLAAMALVELRAPAPALPQPLPLTPDRPGIRAARSP